MMRARRLRRTGLATLGVLAGGLVFAGSPALAAAPETPVTEAPTANTTGTTATLNGELNPGLATEQVAYRFAYSAGPSAACTESGLTAPGEPFPEAEGNHEKVSTPVTGLEGSTEYTVCLIAANPAEPAESTQGTSVKFKTPTSKPVVVGQTVSGITPFDATLEGQVNPENQETTYHLEDATNAAFTTGVATLAYGIAGPGVSAVQTLGPVDLGSALTPNTTYYYRVVAKNASGETKGTVEHPFEQFTTETLKAPSIDGESVTGVTQTNAELHAAINPEYQETEYQFKLGTSVAYGVDAPAALTVLGGAGFFGDIEPVVNLNGEAITLAPNTEYHYEAIATNAAGTTEGLLTTPGDQTFLTLPPSPTATTGAVSEVSPYAATIAGTVNPGSTGLNSDTTYFFQYGTDTRYSSQPPGAPGDAGQGETPVPESASLTGLAPGTTYHYRIVASNDNTNAAGGPPQLVHGEDRTFTTTATPPLLTGIGASQIGQGTATITATLQAQGLPVRWELRLGMSPESLQPQAAMGNTSAAGPEPLTLSIEHLASGTTYYYKLIAISPDGSAETPTLAFATAPGPPAPETLGQTPSFPLLSIPANIFPNEQAISPAPILKLSNAQKLKNALIACRKKAKGKRAACERAARKRFGPIKRKK